MNDIQVPHNFTPRDYQLKLFQAMDGIQGKPETKKRRAFLRWHRRAGKDKACYAYMVKEMVQNPGVYYYMFPTYEQGRKALWENIDKDGFKTLHHLHPSLIKRMSNQSMTIELTNGSIFRMIGTDDIDKVVGTNPKGVVFSEYSLQDPRAWDFVRPILRENGGWAIFNGTPRGRNHMYEMDIRIKNNERWYYSALSVNDTDVLTDEDIEHEREEGMDEDTIQQEYYVSYSAGTKGAFYADQIEKARTESRIGDFPADDHLWVDTFWDLGIDDSTAIWFRQCYGRKIIWIDYFEDDGKSIAHYVNILKEKGYRYRTHYLPHDGAAKNIQTMQRTDEIFAECCKQAGISDDIVVAPRLPVQDGINAVRSRFSRYYFNEGLCADGIKKLELYHRRYDAKKRVFIQHPVHDWTSHCADAIRVEALIEEFDDTDVLPQNQIRVIKDYDIFDD